jgi:predicted ATP-dependent endonuclease of OLD family
LENFLEKIQNKADAHVQIFLTSHSSHIANTTDFAKIRYAQRTPNGVVYKNLKDFAESKPENTTFIRKYLTLARCDLFFADKIILVEGASERLLLPDMIAKCAERKLFDSQKHKLPAQYYSIIEVGGAYAHLFVPLLEFLGIPSLILTDIDSISGGAKGEKTWVSKGKTTSNATLKYWRRRVKNVAESDTSRKIKLSDIFELTPDEKTIGKIRIEFQTEENGLCGRSLEEAMMNVNREFYGLPTVATEKDIAFKGKNKTDFALKLIYEYFGYEVPEYIKSGLRWLNDQLVFTEKSEEPGANEQDA